MRFVRDCPHRGDGWCRGCVAELERAFEMANQIIAGASDGERDAAARVSKWRDHALKMESALLALNPKGNA
jgi:hypothetical protein